MPKTDLRVVGAQTRCLLNVGYRLFVAAEKIFGERPRHVQPGKVWIDCESGVGGGDSLGRALRDSEVIGFHVVGTQIVVSERYGPVCLTEHLCLVIDLGVWPSERKILKMGVGRARQ